MRARKANRRIFRQEILTCRPEKRKLLRSNRLPQFPEVCNGNWAGEIYTFSTPHGRAAGDERQWR
jgi:hypothetical protein